MHDYVIVGAGTAGCVLAARLSEDPDVSVLLVEAGPAARRLEVAVPAAFPRLYGGPLDWAYRTAPQEALDGREIVYPRGRMVGGSASLNAMMVVRGHRSDHDEWGVPGWSWADLEPCYARSAAGPFPRDRRRRAGTLTTAFVEAARAHGLPAIDVSEPDGEGVGLVPTSTRRGRRYSVVHGYLRPVRRRANLTMLTGAHVTRVLFDGRHATGVEALLDGHEETLPAAREVILAAGAVDTPKLLLLSGVGPAAELAAHGIGRVADLSVGENLRDHVANGLLVATEGAPTLYTAERIRHLAQWLVLRRGPLTSNVAEAAAFLRSDPSLPAPDLELIFAPVPFEEEGTVPPSRDGITVAVVLLQPRSTGTVRLRSPDPRDPPIIDPRFLTDPDGHDEAVLLHGVRIARELVAREPLSRYAWGEILPGDDVVDEDGLRAHLRARSQTLYHPVGTCALGSVVERDLRVHGLDGLRVVDASVLPRLPRGHTNWPVVAVAERASDLVREART